MLTDPLAKARFLTSAAGSLLGLIDEPVDDFELSCVRDQIADAMGLGPFGVPMAARNLALWCLEQAYAITRSL